MYFSDFYIPTERWYDLVFISDPAGMIHGHKFTIRHGVVWRLAPRASTLDFVCRSILDSASFLLLHSVGGMIHRGNLALLTSDDELHLISRRSRGESRTP